MKKRMFYSVASAGWIAAATQSTRYLLLELLCLFLGVVTFYGAIK